jgi:HSP20 family protein
LRKRGPLFDASEVLREFNDIHKELDQMLNVFNDKSSTSKYTSKEIIRKYETSDGAGKIRKIGPIVYGYSMTIGPDGKPHLREFGNVGAISNKNVGQFIDDDIDNSQIFTERESLFDVTTTEKEVKIVLEMPGINEEDIKINTYEDEKVEIKTTDISARKYYKVVDLPKEANTDTSRFTYNNGILEITFDKKSSIKTKAKDAFVPLRNILSSTITTMLNLKNKMKH